MCQSCKQAGRQERKKKKKKSFKFGWLALSDSFYLLPSGRLSQESSGN